jgi:hypothetical protein
MCTLTVVCGTAQFVCRIQTLCNNNIQTKNVLLCVQTFSGGGGTVLNRGPGTSETVPQNRQLCTARMNGLFKYPVDAGFVHDNMNIHGAVHG